MGYVEDAKKKLAAAAEQTPLPDPAPTPSEPAPAEAPAVQTGKKYCADDLALIFAIFILDIPLEVADLVLVAQARYYMSIRKDGRIPPVVKRGIESIHAKYSARVKRNGGE